MGLIGEVVGNRIKNGLREIILKLTDFNYQKSPRQLLPPGIDSVPILEDQGVLISVGSDGKNVQLGVYPSPDVAEGEIRIYARNANGDTVSEVHCKSDGTVQINDGSDYAVQFTALKTEFEKLQNAWDTFASAYVPGSPTVTGTPPTASASGSVIDNAKITTVRLP